MDMNTLHVIAGVIIVVLLIIVYLQYMAIKKNDIFSIIGTKYTNIMEVQKLIDIFRDSYLPKIIRSQILFSDPKTGQFPTIEKNTGSIIIVRIALRIIHSIEFRNE
jgi:hypothetical protein